MRQRNIVLSLLLLLSIEEVCAQVSHGGTPPSFATSLVSAAPSLTMPSVDVLALSAEDAQSPKDTPYRFAADVAVVLNLNNSGTWESLLNGDRVWRLRISSPLAYSIGLLYDRWFLPQGAQLFLYNDDRSHVLGAFTSANNWQDGTNITQPVKGDAVTLELLEPRGVIGQSELSISYVNHGYRDVFGWFRDPLDEFGDADTCHNNVNCPEAAAWQTQKRGVVLIISAGSRLCSGSMINNTAQDGTPYVLTAFHCLNGNQTNWLFMFNYESPTCANADGPTTQTVANAVQRAAWEPSDFALLELATPVPASYGAILNGWNKTLSPVTSCVGIHHPRGDVKKISFENDSAQVTGPGGSAGNLRWKVVDWDDGVTAPGSSGSPLFDQNGRIRGQLVGGQSQCNNNSSDYYGNLYRSWDGGGMSATRLRDWLDPAATNEDSITTLDVTGAGTCAFPYEIQSLPFCFEDNLLNYSRIIADCGSPNVNDTLRDCVFRYYSEYAQVIHISMCGTACDPTLGLWRGACPDNVSGGPDTLVACFPGGPGGCPGANPVPCLTSWPLSANTVYYFVVNGARFPTAPRVSEGPFRINITDEYYPASPGWCTLAGACVGDTIPDCPYSRGQPEVSGDGSCAALTAASTIQLGDTICSVLGTHTDHDWYLLRIPDFDPTLYSRYLIEVWGDDTPGQFAFGRGCDPQVRLLNACNGTFIGGDDNSGTGNDARLFTGCFLEQDSLYIEVWPGVSAGIQRGPYAITVSKIDCPAGESQFNPIPVAEIPFCYCGNTADFYSDFGSGGSPSSTAPDVFFLYTSPVTQTISATVCGSDFTFACIAIVRQSNFATIGSNCDHLTFCTDRGCLNGWTLDAGESYYFVVDGAAFSPQSGNFELIVRTGNCCTCAPCTISPCPHPNRDIEPANNACFTQPPDSVVSCGDTLCGTITAGDVDWYRIGFAPQGMNGQAFDITIDVIASGAPSELACLTALNPALEVRLGCASLLALDSDGGLGSDSRVALECMFLSGYTIVDDILIGVSGEGGTFGDYKLVVNCSPCPPPGDTPETPLDVYGVPATITLPVVPGYYASDYTPFCPSSGDGPDVYFIYTPQVRETLCTSLEGTDFPATLEIWRSAFPGNPGTSLAACDSGDTVSPACITDLILDEFVPYGFIVDGFPLGPVPGNLVLTLLHSTDPNCPCEIADVCPHPNRDDETSNNTCNTVNIATTRLTCGSVVCGEISAAGDQDWYVVTLDTTAPIQLIFDVFGNDDQTQWPYQRGLNPHAALYNCIGTDSSDCCEIVAYDLDGGVGSDATVVSACFGGTPSDTFGLLVGGEGGSTGPYVISVLCLGCIDEAAPCTFPCPAGARLENEPCPGPAINQGCEFENGNFVFDTLQCGDTVCGHLTKESGADNEDWYLTRLSESSRLSYHYISEARQVIRLYRAGPQDSCSGMDLLLLREVSPCDPKTIVCCVQPGLYFFQVIESVGGDDYTCEPYTLTLRCDPCTPDTCPRVEHLRGQMDAALGVIHYTFDPISGADEYRIYASDEPLPTVTPADYHATVTTAQFDYPTTAAKKFLIVIGYCRGRCTQD